MTKLILIAAMDQQRVIGHNNALPWHMPADLQHFKQLTLGKPILMGRKTYESIGKPLPKRTNIILTHQPDYCVEGCVVVNSLEQALQQSGEAEEVMVIGGAGLFQQTLPQASRLYLTFIEHNFEGDTYFPELNPAQWQIVEQERHQGDEKNPYPYRFETWEPVGRDQ